MQANVWRNQTAAWPVANPILTCASVSNAGFPSNFVADPFIYVQVIPAPLVQPYHVYSPLIASQTTYLDGCWPLS